LTCLKFFLNGSTLHLFPCQCLVLNIFFLFLFPSFSRSCFCYVNFFIFYLNCQSFLESFSFCLIFKTSFSLRYHFWQSFCNSLKLSFNSIFWISVVFGFDSWLLLQVILLVILLSLELLSSSNFSYMSWIVVCISSWVQVGWV